MRKAIMLLIVASGLLLAGCCTPHRAAKWEYKTVHSTSDEILNTPVAEGWTVIGFSASDSGNRWFLLRRARQ